MKSRDAIGKRIVAIRHTRWWNVSARKMECSVDALVLEDGTELRTFAGEREFDCYADLVAARPTKKQDRRDRKVS